MNEFKFHNPAENSVDLDNDSLDEFVVIDNLTSGGEDLFTMYIFNTLDSFYLADSIQSGYLEPYFTLSGELGEIILVAGNADFMQFKMAEAQFLPVNCFKYESGELLQINDELYDIFISENESILEFIDEYFNLNIKNCNNTNQIFPAIASAYANYINAGEPTLAHQLLENYYYCDDSNRFIEQIEGILNK